MIYELFQHRIRRGWDGVVSRYSHIYRSDVGRDLRGRKDSDEAIWDGRSVPEGCCELGSPIDWGYWDVLAGALSYHVYFQGIHLISADCQRIVHWVRNRRIKTEVKVLRDNFKSDGHYITLLFHGINLELDWKLRSDFVETVLFSHRFSNGKLGSIGVARHRPRTCPKVWESWLCVGIVQVVWVRGVNGETVLLANLHGHCRVWNSDKGHY